MPSDPESQPILESHAALLLREWFGAAPPSMVFRQQVKELREARGWSQEVLARRIRDQLGQPMLQSTIAKIEAGKKRVLLEDFLVVAMALDVAPIHLIVPTRKAFEVVPGEKGRAVDPRGARAWIRGELPLSEDPIDRAFYEKSRPPEEQFDRRDDLLLHLVRKTASARSHGDSEWARDFLTRMQREVERQLDELEEE
jgi:transcriptional regulator with XRE-family HTH domain